MPAIKRQATMPMAVCWKAMITVAAVYQSNEQVKNHASPEPIRRESEEHGSDEEASEGGGDKTGEAVESEERPRRNWKNSPLRTNPGPM